MIFLLGGARSGKSALAVELGRRWDGPVVFLATAEALDDEMRERVARHRAERPAGWTTVEEPVELRAAIEAAPADACLIVDCLSLWAATLLERGLDVDAEGAARAAAARTALTVAVSNEVGLGVVPATPLGRAYRDVLGRVNAVWAAAAETSALVVAGRLLPLASADSLVRRAGP